MPMIRVPTKFGRANLRNGLVKVVAVEVTTVMNAEGVPDFTTIQVETSQGNIATGHIRFDSEALAQLARQWLELYGGYFPLAGASLCQCGKPFVMLAMGYCPDCDDEARRKQPPEWVLREFSQSFQRQPMTGCALFPNERWFAVRDHEVNAWLMENYPPAGGGPEERVYNINDAFKIRYDHAIQRYAVSRA